MIKIKIFLLLFGLVTGFSSGQEIKSKADKYFYGYAYNEAIIEYRKEMEKGALTNSQRLNLADAYFKTGDHERASEIYLDVAKNDTIMSDHRFNKMLQSLSKTTKNDQIGTLLQSNSAALSGELVENADFNFELLNGGATASNEFNVFNVEINTPQADFSPSFYKNDLLFSSSRSQKSKQVYAPSGESYLDIFSGKIDATGNVTGASSFTGIPDSKFHESTPFFSNKMNKVFYIASNEQEGELLFNEKGKNALAIVIADRPTGGNTSSHYLLRDLSVSFYYPYLDESSDRLYFAANFDGGYGGTDIYYVSTFNGQIMSQPVNLGPRVNSPGNEIAPFLFENSLYFSSDVFYGLGGMDIYRTNIRPDQTFSIPVNLGTGVNSYADDFGFIIKEDPTSGFMGYFASNRKGGKGNDDIYGFKVSNKPGLKTFALSGKVTAPRSGDPIADVSIKILDAQGNVVKEVRTGADGDYQLEIPWRETIVLEATKKKHSMFKETYDSAGQEELEKGPLNIEMAFLQDVVERKEDKTVLKLKKLSFARGKSDLGPETILELDKVVDLLHKFPDMRLTIESYTDSRGSNYTNEMISQQRANEVRAYLIKNGVPSDNVVSAIGYGETKITNNCTNGVFCLDFLHDQNVRTLFVVTNYDELNQ